MAEKYIIGIDQSTQGTKALLFDEEGTILRRTDKSHEQIISEKGWVSHDSMEIYRNTIEVGKRPLEVRLAEIRIGVAHLRQILRIDAEKLTYLLVPFEVEDVEKLRSGSVGVIRLIHLAACQLVYEPAVHGTVADLAAVGLLLRSLYIFQYPRDL